MTASLLFIYHYKLAEHIPVDGDISYKDLAAKAGRPPRPMYPSPQVRIHEQPFPSKPSRLCDAFGRLQNVVESEYD